MNQITIGLHGGCGTLAPHLQSEADWAEARQHIAQALRAGWRLLQAGGSAVDAVQAAVVVMEDSPHFNAGHGAALTETSQHELDASIMDGATLAAGAVCLVRRTRNPVLAARKVLAKAGLTVDDIDLFEINEAFAVVAEKFIRDLKLDRDKVNVNGGAMALGHPIGATGSILIGTLLDELERRDLKRGLVTMCAGGGMAPAIIVERM